MHDVFLNTFVTCCIAFVSGIGISTLLDHVLGPTHNDIFSLIAGFAFWIGLLILPVWAVYAVWA